MAGARPIRVTIQQPSLPSYRVAVFRELASRPGIDLTVVHGSFKGLAVASPEGFRAVPVRPHPNWSPLGSRLANWQRLPSKYVRKSACDVLVLNWNIRHLSLVPTILTSRLRGVPVVLWGHGYSKFDGPGKRMLRWNIARLGEAVVLYNYSTAEALVRAGLHCESVFTASNALDQSAISAERARCLANPAEVEDVRRRLSLTPADRGGLTTLFVSRLMEANRVDVLIEAIARLRRTGRAASAIVVGEGAEAQRLSATAQRLGISQHVHMIGGIYNEAKLAPLFLASDAFVYPSNVGLSILHAMGYGLPVVLGDRVDLHNPEAEALRPAREDGTNASGAPVGSISHTNGLTFRHDDADDLARVLVLLADRPAWRASLSAGALATVREWFTIDRMVNGLESAIRFAVRHTRLELAPTRLAVSG